MNYLTQRILAPVLGVLLVGPAFGQQPPPQPPPPAAPPAPPAVTQPPAPAQVTQAPAPAQPTPPAQPPAVTPPAAPAQPTAPTAPNALTQARNPNTFESPGQAPPIVMTFGRPVSSDPNVSQFLNLSNAQLGELHNATGKLQARYQGELSRIVSQRAPNQDAQIQQLRQRYHEELRKATERFLKPEQQTRFRQLELQYRGLSTFNDPTVQQRLNLTRDQLDRFKGLNEQRYRALRELTQNSQANQAEATQRLDALRRQTQEQANAILNPVQRRAWQEMTGERFNFASEYDQKSR